jgi:hypothetical protein
MSESTRRGFLILAGAGAAAAAGVAAIAANGAGPAAADQAVPAGAPADGPATAAGPLVAYVQDVRSDRVSVMVGESEVVVSDPDLVARLARAAAGKKA